MNTIMIRNLGSKRLIVIISILVFTVLICRINAEYHTRAEWIAKFDDISGGDGYSNSSDPYELWTASFWLRGYLNMYEATGDVKYLDIFVDNVENMIATMEDSNNDGYDGWDTADYSVNLIQNPEAEEFAWTQNVQKTTILEDNFETCEDSPYDATLPDSWVRWQSSSSTAYLDSENEYSGNYCLTVKTVADPQYGWQIIDRTISYDVGKNYCLTFWGKVSGTNAVGRVRITDFDDNKNLADYLFADTSWTEHRIYFVAPAEAGHTIKIRLYHQDWNVPNIASHFDVLLNLDIVKISRSGLERIRI